YALDFQTRRCQGMFTNRAQFDNAPHNQAQILPSKITSNILLTSQGARELAREVEANDRSNESRCRRWRRVPQRRELDGPADVAQKSGTSSFTVDAVGADCSRDGAECHTRG